VTSNVNITVEDEDGRAMSVPIGERFAKFATKRGRKVTALGVIFDFQAHGKNITVHSPAHLAVEAWFLEVIEDVPDYFVLVGHMPARGETSEWAPVFETIRRRHPRVPVFVFGGHTHVRDCTQYDDRSIAIVPGRYMETTAFTSSSLPDNSVEPLSVSRRYLDGNRRTYQFHAHRMDDFDTPIGLNITDSLLRLACELGISRPLGLAPQDLFLGRYAYGHPRSVLTEWTHRVIPMTVRDPSRNGPAIFIAQAGTLRFDVVSGVPEEPS
jgi:hypothetical protein